MYKDTKSIRQMYGDAIKKYRIERERKISQTQLCNKINCKLNDISLTLYQKQISRIESADTSISLPHKIIEAISEECRIPEDISEPFLKLMNNIEDIDRNRPQIHIEEYDQLLVKPSHTELQIYQGEYYCYFYSTDSSEPKIIKGKLSFNLDYKQSICRTDLKILINDEPIKEYKGQFILNSHYRKIYIILIGNMKQEVCFLIFNHFNSTINYNQLNMALALTTSSGSQKRPTMHRMLISRKQLSDETIKLITPELKLNTDIITISENNLNDMEKELEIDSKNKKYNDVILKCIKYIKEKAKKEYFYTIDESIIYDSSEITVNDIERSYIISLLRDKANTEYYNKISDTVEEICLKIIDDMENQKD